MSISQREARRLRKRVTELESAEEYRRRAWSQEFVGGVEIARATWDDKFAHVPQAVRVARKLKHAVVCVGDDSGLVRFVALPIAKART